MQEAERTAVSKGVHIPKLEVDIIEFVVSFGLNRVFRRVLMFSPGVLTFQEFAMQEALPLATLQSAVLEFLRGRDDVAVFGAQAVNAYVSELTSGPLRNCRRHSASRKCWSSRQRI